MVLKVPLPEPREMPVEFEKLSSEQRQLLRCYWRASVWKKLGHVVSIKMIADYVEEDFKWGDLTRSTITRYINELRELGFEFELADAEKLEKKIRKPRLNAEIKHTVADDPTPEQKPIAEKKVGVNKSIRARTSDPIVPQLRQHPESGADELIGEVEVSRLKPIKLKRKNTAA